MWSNSTRTISRKNKKVEIINGASDDSLQRFAVACRDKRSDKAPQSSKPRSSNRRASITSEKHKKSNLQVVQIDGRKTQTVVSACKKIAARTKPRTAGTTSQVELGKPTKMTLQQRQAQFGKQWNVVQTTAGGTNTIPTRQHPELGQTHRARMNCQAVQRVTAGQTGSSSHASTVTTKCVHQILDLAV